VKNLLNAFVLTYRLAEAREQSGRLHGDMIERADEIARLVCLRIEFPLFANKLVLDARLPEYVLRLWLAEPEERVWADHPHATAQVRRLARDYAGLKLPVATLLATSGEDHVEDNGDDDGTTNAGPEDRTADQDVERQHGRQLLDYLSRTRSVRGPARDLLFMQSEGAEVGLDGQLAERIEEDASNGAVQPILAAVKDLDEDGQQAVLTLLIEQSRRAVGLEARGVALSLLAVASVGEVDVPSRTDALADALAPALSADPKLIDEGGLFGAWRLGLHSARPTARELLGLVLRSESAKQDIGIGTMILRHSDTALDADTKTTAGLLARYLLSLDGDDAAGTAQVLRDMSPEEAARLIAAARPELAAGLAALLIPPPTPPVATPTPGRVAGAQQPQAAEPVAELPDPAPVLGALTLLLEQLARGTGGPAQALASVVLDVDHQDTRNLVENHLGDLGQIDDPEFGAQILKSCVNRVLSNWPTWLTAVSSMAVPHRDMDDALLQALNSLWAKSVSTTRPPTSAEIRAAATAVVGLLDHRPEEQRPELRIAVLASLGEAVEDDEQATKRMRLLRAVEDLITTGALKPGVIAAKEAEDLPTTLRADLAVLAQDDPLVVYVSAAAPDSLAGWARPGITGEPPSSEQAAALVKALYESPWLPEPVATALPLLARALASADDNELPSIPSAQDIAALRDEHGDSVDSAVAAWIRLADPSAEDLLVSVRSALSSSQPDSGLVTALGERARELTPKDRLTLVEGFLRDPDLPAPTTAVLRAAGSQDVPDVDIARVLVARQAEATNEARRRLLLDAWERSGIESNGARRLLIEQVLIPLFKNKASGGSDSAVNLGLEYLPRLARTQPGTKTPLGRAVVDVIGQDRAADVLKPLGYKSSKSGLLRRKTVETD
jgi:hypothetical protein